MRANREKKKSNITIAQIVASRNRRFSIKLHDSFDFVFGLVF
jgi:hypothetical protein